MEKIFETDKVIRLGIWGLGRGKAFIKQCEDLQIQVVAGCDLNESACEDFRKICPDAYITQSEDDFLAQDLDAVLVATYFFTHARDSIKALQAGKHVLCEVTSFFTPAEGVLLAEAVEASGKIYMLAENYTKPFLKQLWDEGIFGELVYAEYDYVHECRPLSYSYLYGDPVQPGNTVHSWRSWLNFHYYCTHSLGPVMETTSTRPVKVSAPESRIQLPGYLPVSKMGGMQPSFVTMDNGGVVRNLMGASTKDSHQKKIWGSRAFADMSGESLEVSLGQCGRGPKIKLANKKTKFAELEAKAGHGGGDFWVLYNFANAILNGVKPYWDVYAACDVTLTGIMAVKSQYNGGIPVEVPDFRKKEVRDQYRNDHFAQEKIDPAKIFPEDQDLALTSHFSSIMNDLDRAWCLQGVPLLISALDGIRVYPYIEEADSRLAIQNTVRKALAALPAFVDALHQAKILADKYPDSPGGKALQSYIDSACPEKMADPDALRNELQTFLLRADLPRQKQLQMYMDKETILNSTLPAVPEGFTLRTFREGDEEAYIDLMKSAGFHTWNMDLFKRIKSNVLGDGIFFIEETATGRLAATAMANQKKADCPEKSGELGWVGVNPDFRGKKLAAIVCAKVLDHYKKAGYERVTLLTDDFRTPAIKTYLKAGFQPLFDSGDEETFKRWDVVYKKLGLILKKEDHSS